MLSHLTPGQDAHAGLPDAVIVVRAVAEHLYLAAGAKDEVLVDDEGYSVMEVDGLQLVVHALPGEPQVAEGQLRVREDSYVKLCLPVESIAAARALAAANGGAIKPAQHEWEARGFRACDGHDPEGNVIQVRETAK